MERVYLSHLGIICALGTSCSEVFKNMLSGKTLNKNVKLRCKNKMTPVGLVEHDKLPNLPKHLKAFSCLNHRMVYAALLQIEDGVQKAIQTYGANRIGVVIGSSTSGLDATEKVFFGLEESIPYQFSTQHEMGSISTLIKNLSGISGPGFVISTACSSSSKAFVSARNLILLGICDAVICGGGDALCELTLNGFDSLESISESLTNPFSRNRKGLNIGEGAALFLMTKDQSRVSLIGAGESNDAYHLSAPNPEGEGAEIAIQNALDDAKISSDWISYINLHGTGTLLNDAMEAKTISRIFGSTPCSSTKPLTGHTLGAAGAIEAALCWLTLNQKEKDIYYPLHCYDAQDDSELPILNFSKQGETHRIKALTRILSTSYAFGGSNCALIFEGVNKP